MADSMTDAPFTVRDSVIDLMRSFGATKLFGNPGSTELPLFRNFPSDFRYVLGLHEGVVVGMAEGYAQAKRNASFVSLHSAAGVGNAMGVIFTAYKTGRPWSSWRASRRGRSRRSNPSCSPPTRSNCRSPMSNGASSPARAADVPLAIARGYHIAMTPPRGPVFVSIPADDWDRLARAGFRTASSARSCAPSLAFSIRSAPRSMRAKDLPS